MLSTESLAIRQSNAFYNYTVGLEATDVDLLSTAGRLLKSGLARAACFSDLKCLYIDEQGDTRLEWVRPNGRQWDPSWTVKFSPDVPPAIVTELTYSIELAFHEQRIEGREARQMPSYLRAALPPVVLESDELLLPLESWVKVFANGIVIVSFQLDATWDDVDEQQWISIIVNLFQRYFDDIWVDAQLQRMDLELLFPHAFQDEMKLAGRTIGGRKLRRLQSKMRKEQQAALDDAFGDDGREFEFGGDQWNLHKIAGSEEQKEWEATIELCRSQYVNALASLIMPQGSREPVGLKGVRLWHGRPSISLMRFKEQPSSKSMLLDKFGQSLSRILNRSTAVEEVPELPPDLRRFEDYCFHGNRAILLWTWLRSDDAPDDAWEDSTTHAVLTENQARAEHFEYHNMRIARACSLAGSPPSADLLVEAYETLASAEDVIHHSSQSGEVTDALAYLLSAIGTTGLVPAAKERARWHLDESRYRVEKRRAAIDRWIGFVFGLVGTSGLADLVIKPLIVDTYPALGSGIAGLWSFGLAGLVVVLLAVPVWVINRRGVL